MALMSYGGVNVLGVEGLWLWLIFTLKDKMTKEEFEKGYAERSDLTLERLHELGMKGAPCDCFEDICQGWQMLFEKRSIVYDR